jgi:signal transduction histidine kinase/phage shock protein PspC (stress-responsive transcriptional regulator)
MAVPLRTWEHRLAMTVDAGPRDRPRLRRSASDRVIAGVSGGLGERLEIDPVVIRLAFVVLTFAGGAGVIAYLGLFLMMGWPDVSVARPAPTASARQAVSVAFVVLGVLLICREAGLWWGDGVVWPVVLGVLGSAVIWTRGDDADRARWARFWRRVPGGSPLEGRGSGVRTALGLALIALGLWAFAVRNLALIANAPLAVLSVLVGLAVIVGPWVWRLVRQVADERRERIRQEERAEMAAHLHDSVLQTLALIQRADEPREMVSLARAQERELRTWLYGGATRSVPGSLSAALDDTAAEVEATHRTRIEVVLVGDLAVDDAIRALVDACREAMVNAARHSGARGVSVYVEVDDEAVTAFVRDQGIGFSPIAIPSDRHGIAESIVGRMERNGGVALVESEPGRGTEVRLRMPRIEP